MTRLRALNGQPLRAFGSVFPAGSGRATTWGAALAVRGHSQSARLHERPQRCTPGNDKDRA